MKFIFKINGSYQLSIRSLWITIISAFLAFHILILHGFTNPDGICEGLTYYTNGDWALSGCGRWAIRYMNELTCNIVIPLYVVLVYSICIWLSIILLSKTWQFADSDIIVMSIILIVTPAIAEQLTYTYTALAYAFSCLLSVLFTYLIFRQKWYIALTGGALSIALMMGLYQSYVGMVAVLVVMTIILELINCKSGKMIVQEIGLATCTALIGYFIYSIILDWELKWRGLNNSGTRVAEFSFEQILESFSERLRYVYYKFFLILTNQYMHRNVLYWIIIIICCIALLLGIWQCIQNRKYGRIAFIGVMALIIPLASNIIGILIPYNGLEVYMQYQAILIVPFMFAIIHLFKKEGWCYSVTHKVTLIVAVVLAWTFILAANATYKCYELSYRHINSQMQIALTRVYDLDKYIMNETPILIAGIPDDSVLRNNLDIYQYAENLYENPAFWPTMHGVTQNRYLYFLDYFGIDAKRFSDDEYATIINSAAFAEMPVWPAKESVAMIDGFAVVKFVEEPVMP